MNGVMAQKAVVHLILADQPHRTYVRNSHGFRDSSKPPPTWNRFPLETNFKTSYSNLFNFSIANLGNDGGLVVFMPHMLRFELHKVANKRQYWIATKWICQQLEPLLHILFENIKVCLL